MPSANSALWQMIILVVCEAVPLELKRIELKLDAVVRVAGFSRLRTAVVSWSAQAFFSRQIPLLRQAVMLD
ncbi:MAG: hypothetical protein A2Y50_12205 [Pseudomonadales bacterium RIFCSPLOWO2_12_59_9]|nr:MAG: hypothetical protein A2Y50_12205 [Pseudomonadales bacterium RIFCSPLOWO2_12_59_9]